MFLVRWLMSGTVRQATDLCSQANKVLSAQRDLLTETNIAEVKKGIADLRETIRMGGSKADIKARMTALEKTASNHLKPYPSASIRENIEVFLVAGVVALAVRTFLLQPMAIPSGSAQPTLFGITHVNYVNQPDFKLPTGLERWIDSYIQGDFYYEKKATQGGTLRIIDREPTKVALFFKKQRFAVGNEQFTMWSPPDQLFNRAGLHEGMQIPPNTTFIKLKVSSGDHLFVNRVTYNFRQPRRGETIVFESTGVPRLIQNTHYIKRLVALGGEKVRLGDDRHLVINGKRLDASTPGFENVYTFSGPPVVDHYSGHVNGKVAAENGKPGLAEWFPDGNTERTIRPNHYLTFGDNTMNSFDSRDWEDFPREKTVGKSGFVFWPITSRFGWGQN